MDGEYGAAAEDLAKGGKALEGHDDARGGTLMVAACENIEQIEEEGKLGMSVDVYKQAVAYMLRTAQLGAAAALLRKQMPVHHRLQQPHGVARAALSLVVVGLASDDFDGAEAAHHAALERGDGYAGSDEAGVGGRLLQGYTSQSEEALAAAVRMRSVMGWRLVRLCARCYLGGQSIRLRSDCIVPYLTLAKSTRLPVLLCKYIQFSTGAQAYNSITPAQFRATLASARIL